MSFRLLAILGFLMFLASLPTASMGDVWRDDFDGTDIGPGWEFINLSGQCTYEVAAGWFSLNLEGHNDIWGGFDNSAKLLRDAPAGDYTLETHIVIEPDAAAKTAETWTSIIVFDDTNAVSSDWWYIARGGNDEVNTEYVKNNAGFIQASLKGIGDLELYLKAEKTDQTYTGYYKIEEDDEWIKVGAFEHDTLKPLKVGLMVKSWAIRSMVSKFDYFEMVGEKVESNISVAPKENLITTWGQRKEY